MPQGERHQTRDTRRETLARARGGSKEAGMPVSPPCQRLLACAWCSSPTFILLLHIYNSCVDIAIWGGYGQ